MRGTHRFVFIDSSKKTNPHILNGDRMVGHFSHSHWITFSMNPPFENSVSCLSKLYPLLSSDLNQVWSDLLLMTVAVNGLTVTINCIYTNTNSYLNLKNEKCVSAWLHEFLNGYSMSNITKMTSFVCYLIILDWRM